MKRLFRALILAGVFCALALPAFAAKKAAKPAAFAVDVVSAEATVDSVDAAKKSLVLKRADGSLLTLKVGDKVKNFDQIKKGDAVKARYYNAIAVFVVKSSEKPQATDTAMVDVAPKGQKPEALSVETVQLVAKVKAIDLKKRLVTLEGPQGGTLELNVDKAVKNFKNIKKGDDVVVRHTVAVAVEVVKP